MLLVLLAHVRPGPRARPPRQAQAVRRRFRSGPGERRAGAGPARPRAARQGDGTRPAARGPSREDHARDAAEALEQWREGERPAHRRERGAAKRTGCRLQRVASPGGRRRRCSLGWRAGPRLEAGLEAGPVSMTSFFSIPDSLPFLTPFNFSWFLFLVFNNIIELHLCWIWQTLEYWFCEA